MLGHLCDTLGVAQKLNIPTKSWYAKSIIHMDSVYTCIQLHVQPRHTIIRGIWSTTNSFFDITCNHPLSYEKNNQQGRSYFELQQI